MILYDLSYNYRNYVLTLFYDNPKKDIIDDRKIFCKLGLYCIINNHFY